MTVLEEFEKQNRKDICQQFIDSKENDYHSFLEDTDCFDIVSVDEDHDEVYSEPGNYEADDMMYEFCLNHAEYWGFVAEYFEEWK